MFQGPLTESLLGRAREKAQIDVRIHNLRDYTDDVRHKKVDDRPYGGGAGMVIRAEPIYRALKSLKHAGKPYIVYLSPQGRRLTQAKAQSLAKKSWLVLLCGHYEGIDERAMSLVDEEISIGDFVLTGGELPAMVLADTILRFVPGVVKEESSIQNDSFQNGLLDYPHYTRPALWRGKKVPEILLSGDHPKIQEWRRQQSLAATKKKRPDLLSAVKPGRKL